MARFEDLISIRLCIRIDSRQKGMIVLIVNHFQGIIFNYDRILSLYQKKIKDKRHSKRCHFYQPIILYRLVNLERRVCLSPKPVEHPRQILLQQNFHQIRCTSRAVNAGCLQRMRTFTGSAKKKRFPSMYYTSKSRDGIRHIANSSHVYRVTSLHSFPRWFILTTNRSVLEILSLEAYQNVRNVLRLIAPRIHLSRRSPHPLFAFGFR